MNWKFTDETNRVVMRTNPDGTMDSRLARTLAPEQLATAIAADPPPAPAADMPTTEDLARLLLTKAGATKADLAAAKADRGKPL